MLPELDTARLYLIEDFWRSRDALHVAVYERHRVAEAVAEEARNNQGMFGRMWGYVMGGPTPVMHSEESVEALADLRCVGVLGGNACTAGLPRVPH